jgi:glyoxylase I family protein
MRVLGINHVVLRVNDLTHMVRFYCEVLGCSVERRNADELGLVQLRAGRSLIDLVEADGALRRQNGSPSGGGGRNLHHFCVRVHPFAEEMIREYLAHHDVTCGALEMHYGAEGKGPALCFEDPEGNIVELKGPATGPEGDVMGLATDPGVEDR